MASNPPGACCATANFHEGTPKGLHKELFGLDTYQVGSENGNDNVIVILTDVYGHKLNNTLLIADEIAKDGKYQVLIPDILNGDPIDRDIGDWFKTHGPEITTPIVSKFLTTLKKEINPKFLAGIGYCYGAKYAFKQADKDGLFDAIAVAHPSFVAIEEVKALAKPLIISAAEVDPIYTQELRFETEKVLSELEGARYQLNLFSGVSHGFAVRGDMNDPAVKYAKEKTLSDQLVFFSQFSS